MGFFFNERREKNKQGPYSAPSNLGLAALKIATSRLWRNDSQLMQGLRHALALAQRAETLNKLSRSTRVNT